MNEDVASGMYLRRLHIKNFRSCYDMSLEFQPGITLLVGENNSGKSNVVDAVRLATVPLNRRATKWFEEGDLSHGREDQEAALHTTYTGLTPTQQAQYITALDVGTGEALYTTAYQRAPARRQLKPSVTAGPAGGPLTEPDKREQLTHVYLAPLRDAQKELDSSDGNRLLRIIQYLTTPEQQEDFLTSANKSFQDLKQDDVLLDTSKEIQGHLGELTNPVRGQSIEVTFADYELHRLVRNLRVKMAENGIAPADLAESGLGYANLLFIATVILELRKAQEAELTLFLVEEPEAHLHPQLQAVLLGYLRDQAHASPQDDRHGPAGRIQIIATTHSPNLASSVGLENVVALRTRVMPDTRSGSDMARHETRALPLARIELTSRDRRKINQYLDATRAGLLFARRVILVEGIAEAVLLPILARHCVFGDRDRQPQRRAFHGVTIINVGSVDFAPYMTLLLSLVDGCRLLDRLTIITDRDPPISHADTSEAGADMPGDGSESTVTTNNRRERLLEHAASIGAQEHVVVAEAPHTLEADLLASEVNEPVLRQAFYKQHSRSQHVWQEITEDARGPVWGMYVKLRRHPKFISKGEFAHDVARAIEEGGQFETPEYLAAAIHDVIGDDTAQADR